MFEKLSLRPHSPLDADTPLDLGALVEGLLFYGEAEVLVNPGVIKQIARMWSPEGLLALLNSGVAKFRFQQGLTGIHTANTGSARERYHPVVMALAAGETGVAGPEVLIRRALEEVIGRRGRARRVTAQVCRRLIVEQTDSAITTRVTSDLLDSEYVSLAVRHMLRIFAPGLDLPSNTRFEVQQVEDGLRVLTNIDFVVANALFRRTTFRADPLTPAFLLAHFLSAREILEDAARSGADMAADPVNSVVAAVRIDSLLARRAENESNIARFQDFLFADGRAIREAVNTGRIGVEDVLRLLEKAAKFKSWLHSQPADADLIKEYFRSVTTSTWVDKLPSKTVRWLLFSGLGVGLDSIGAGGLGTALGLALGATDTFVLDRILKGWKPNQFVEDSLRPLVGKSQ
ncbi:MAG TPA: hypothetical protein VF092_00185 [Longimicrobium sp.]